MRSVRLLPVVIFAALALLVFKGIGLVTNGGYVLTGPGVAVAEDAAATGDSLSMPSEAVIADTSPTLGDTQPTIATRAEASSASHASSESSAPPSSSEAGHDTSSSASASSSSEAATVDPNCAAAAATGDHGSAAAGGDLTARIGNALASGCPAAETPVNEHGDALPTTKDGTGRIVPLSVAEGDNSAEALLQRLSERRIELDKREAELAMRADIVAAAEKKLDQRTAELQALEAQVNALVNEKQAAEDAGFKAVVSMYENMKPKDAANVFDQLDLNVLLRVVRAMNPRKMSPILAAMTAQKANDLTTALALVDVQATVASTGENLASLPQIVGK